MKWHVWFDIIVWLIVVAAVSAFRLGTPLPEATYALGFLITGTLWVALREAARRCAVRTGRRRVSIALTMVAPLLVAFAVGIIHLLVPTYIEPAVGRGLLVLCLFLAGWIWGPVSEFTFNRVEAMR